MSMETCLFRGKIGVRGRGWEENKRHESFTRK